MLMTRTPVRLRYLCSLLVAYLLTACAMLGPEDEARIFEGVAGIDKLTPAVQQSSLLVDCPPLAIRTFEYAYRQFPGRAILGRESFQFGEQLQGITGIQMAGEGDRLADLPGIEPWSITRGRQVSCGGLFTLAMSESRSSAGHSSRRACRDCS